jgi:hypothetical protein
MELLNNPEKVYEKPSKCKAMQMSVFSIMTFNAQSQAWVYTHASHLTEAGGIIQYKMLASINTNQTTQRHSNRDTL